MLSQLTIPKVAAADPSVDYRQLYQIGLQHAQQLAGRIWTDYNVHDPGVTTLELLCYALTDLSYRASFPMEDLLAAATDNAANMQGQFFTARKILPNRPLTLLDYRKLLIDLPGVKNAWLQPADVTYYADLTIGQLSATDSGKPWIKPVNLMGLYNVLIEFMEGVADADQAGILDKVQQTLMANRNLCEDFVGFAKVDEQKFLLCCEIELAPDADAETVEAQVLFAVEQYLAPSVKNYSLSEMLAKKNPDGTPYTVDQIFNGPALECGFIDDAELLAAELRTEIHLSDVIALIMDIDGVVAVKDIVVNPQGTTIPLADKWVVPVDAGKKATLVPEASRVLFFKKGMPVPANFSNVEALLRQLEADATAKAETVNEYDLDVPLGRFRQPQTYQSFQNHFPGLYGLSEFGLNSAAGDDRKALTWQLKAYLLFFDQLMADYFAQLSSVKELFSTDPTVKQTYFSQAVKSFKDFEKIYKTATPDADLTGIIEDAATAEGRRNRFLDHLIARFAEQFTDFVNIMYSAFGYSPEGLAAYKCDFLKLYPAISSDRSLAYNYSLKTAADIWDSANVSGLEKRLAKLLGLPNFNRRNLLNTSYDSYAAVQPSGGQFGFQIQDAATSAVLLHSIATYATSADAQAALTRAIFYALLPAGYQRNTAGGKFTFNVIDDQNVVLAANDTQFDTEAERDEAINNLIRYLQERYDDDGMYLIENILLRPDPEQASDPFLPICPESNCDDCSDADPYSYRVHVILPAYSSRFSNVDFRRFVEETIRMETPAHILPKICWINQTDMAAFETAYKDWLSLKCGADTTNRQAKLQTFINILFKVKNVYPPQQLVQCSEAKPKFILNRTALGSLKTEGQ